MIGPGYPFADLIFIGLTDMIFSLPLEMGLGLRFLLAKRKEKFISIITVLAVGGVALSVMTLIVVLAVMSGFERDLRDKILGTNAHIFVTGNTVMDKPYELMDKIGSAKHVKAATPYIFGQIIIRIRDRVVGVALRGINPKLESQVTNIERQLVGGDLTFKSDGIAMTSENGIVIGQELSKRFGLFLGDTLTIMAPTAVMTPLGPASRMVRCKVTGIFHSGMFEYDANLVYVSLKLGQQIFGLGDGVHGISVRLDDVQNTPPAKDSILSVLGGQWTVSSWVEQNKNLFSAIKTEKNVMFILLVLAIAVAATNILSTLIMMVMEKTKDIGILKSVGMSSIRVLKIFLWEGLLVGMAGSFLGLLGGLWFVAKIDTIENLVSRWTGFDVFPRDIYYLDKLPAVIYPLDIVGIVGSAILIALLGAVYPAIKAACLNPVEALRYE